jgi:hypothetical protein
VLPRQESTWLARSSTTSVAGGRGATGAETHGRSAARAAPATAFAGPGTPAPFRESNSIYVDFSGRLQRARIDNIVTARTARRVRSRRAAA